MIDNPLLETPKMFEPKRKNRFLFSFPKNFNIPDYLIQSVTKPIILVRPKKILGLTYGYKNVYINIDVNILDVSNIKTSETLFNNLNKTFTCFITELTPSGEIIEITTLIDCKIQGLSLGFLSHKDDNINLINLSISPNSIKISYDGK